MKSKFFISSWQAMILLVISSIATTVLFVPAGMATIVKQDNWLAAILGTFLAAIFLIYPLAALGMRFPDKTMVEYSVSILGRFLGKIYGALLVFMLFMIHFNTLRELSELMSFFLEETPMEFIIAIFAFGCAYAVNRGFETISRAGEITFLLGIFAIVIIGAASIPDIKLVNLVPVLEQGILPVFRASIHVTDWLATGFIFGMFTSRVSKKDNLKKIGLTGIVIGGGILIGLSILNTLVYGGKIISILNFPLLALARNADIPVIERGEVFVIILWISWIFIRASLFSYCTVTGLAQLFKLADYRFLILPETVLAIVCAIYFFGSYIDLSYHFMVSSPVYLFITTGLPFTLWLVALLRNK